MALAFPNLSWRFWGSKDLNAAASAAAASALGASSESSLGLREPDNLKLSSVRGSKMRSSSSRRVRRKWQSREERRIDRECDLVLVPSDGGCWSASESDDSDWSIGWLEPHSSDFLSDDENDNSFAVLVPCYGCGRGEAAEDWNKQLLGAIISANLPNGYSSVMLSCEGLLSGHSSMDTSRICVGESAAQKR